MRRHDADAPSARTHDPATTSLLATSELRAFSLLNQFGLGAASLVQGLVVFSRPDLQARGRRAAGEVVYQVLRAAFLVAVGLATAKLGLGRELLVFWIVPMFTWKTRPEGRPAVAIG